MKQSRVSKMSRHHNRVEKMKEENTKQRVMSHDEVDVAVIDLVLKTLYHNSHIDVLHIEDDIYKKANLDIPFVEAERLWEVMLHTGLVNPVIGFGNAGKVELSRTGYQIMSQYGGYREYMNLLKGQQQAPQIIIETPAEAAKDDSDCNVLNKEDEEPGEKK